MNDQQNQEQEQTAEQMAEQAAERRAAWDAKIAARQAEEEQAKEEQAEKRFKAVESQRYVQAGGLPADFESEWPGLRKQIVEKRFLNKQQSDQHASQERALRYIRDQF